MRIIRQMSQDIKKQAKYFPVIGIFGPRQSGKTTCAKMSFPDYEYVSVEDLDMRAFAQQDPRGFLQTYTGNNGVIIDEFQNVPELLSYIQTIVDKEQKMGQFILTGSQSFLMNEAISQSLAGRISIHTLLPFSFQELSSAELLSDSIDEVLFTGGYPPLYDRSIPPSRWYSNYILSYIERDVRQIINVENASLFKTFIKLCAGRVGQLLNITSLANDCGISDTTAKRWLSLLESSFIIYLLRPYHNNFGKRLVKTPKLYFYDTGLLSSLLGITDVSQVAHHYARGGIFESLIISQLYKYQYNNGAIPAFYFWRNQVGNEIDLVIEQGSVLIPVEIKSARTVNSKFFSNLRYWYEATNTQISNGVVVYAGDAKQQWEHGAVICWQDVDTIIKKD